MRAARLLSVLSLSALTFPGVAMAAAGPQPLFTLDKAARNAEAVRTLVPDASEDYAIRTNPASVAANPAGFTLDLPGLPTLEAVRTSFVGYKADWKSWFGALRRAGSADEPSCSVYLGFHGSRLTGMIEFEGVRYRIVGDPGDHHLVRQEDTLSQPSCAMDATPLAQAVGRKPGKSPGLTPKATYRLDLLAVYPSAYFALGASAQSSLKTFVQDEVALANNIFVNSSVDAAYNLVGVVPLTGGSQPSAGLYASLNWITGVPTEVANLRNAFGADIVAVFIPFSWNATPACGVANLPQNNNTFLSTSTTGQITVSGDMGDRAFSAHRETCGMNDYTLGHEIGHNYGMYHGDQAPSATAVDSNARGYIFTAAGVTKATVMHCYCPAGGSSCAASANPVCNRVPYFSDPNILYNGTAIGTVNNNNAGFARTRVSTYAAFRSQSTNTPPTANFTVSCSGHVCNFTSTSTDNAAIPSTGYFWDFGDGQTGTGSSPSHTYGSTATSFTTFNVNLVVTDAGGQTGAKASTATTGPTYEGYLENADCRSISGWAWDSGAPNYSISVDILKDGSLVSTVAANGFRQDLVNAGKGNGVHGFGYTPTSTWKDGQWHTVTARFTGTTTSLTWSPRSFICAVSCFPGLTPTENNSTGGVVYTVGTQFSSHYSGYITHLRFYRAAGETGTNTGQLWTDSGSLLAQANFPSSPSSGWVEVALSSPVAVSADVRYRVTVNTNVQQSKTSCGIGSGITNNNMTAYQGFWIAGNGVFPTTSSCSNFFADVKFDY